MFGDGVCELLVARETFSDHPDARCRSQPHNAACLPLHSAAPLIMCGPQFHAGATFPSLPAFLMHGIIHQHLKRLGT